MMCLYPQTEHAHCPPCRLGSEKMYGFSKFTCSLNELEEGVAPTDCRFRPDQRLMEEQDFDKANDEKVHVGYIVRAKRHKCGLTHR